MDYWANKNKLKKRAVEWTNKMEKEYGSCIDKAIELSKIYESHNFNDKVECSHDKDTIVTVTKENTVEAIFNHYTTGDKQAVLNFASYKNPGGQFINGSSAQEESLCHSSFLYNVLRELENEFYSWNRENKNRALYTNRAVFSPQILFINQEDGNKSLFTHVITCAAPNKGAAQQYCGVSDSLAHDYMRKRIRFVLNIAATENIDTLILGAYGCGVFKNDPEFVAKVFKYELQHDFIGVFKKVVFAVPSGPNHDIFKKVFEK